mmetsp:Transcript_17642/g.25521  ORF Transcript_17642/g.25521 Transcript_17642/m.25521 type:complete len:600 (+) Transcript_17642:277-2076(+)
MASFLRHEEMPPDVFHGSPLCMDQFKSLFGSARQPKVNENDIVAVDPTSKHIVVICRNQFYYFQALWPDGTVAVDENDIAEILSAIKEDSHKIDPEMSCQNAIGVLTTLPRKSWAVARENIEKTSDHNRSALELIDSALFVLVLDDFVPRDINEAASNMLHGSYNLEHKKDKYYQAGTCCNRWYDKLQIIVCADGTAGINFEHSAIDGHTALRFVSDIFAETIINFAQSITLSIYGKGRIPSVISAQVRRAACVSNGNGIDISPKKLSFELPLSLRDTIFFAETAIGDQVVSTETFVLEFKSYGKEFVKANRMSPDSFVQMTILLAYYQLYGKVVCAYEPVLTKHFYHGRTEAMRTSTEKAAAFCRKWCNHYATKEEKLQALRDATVEHSRLVKESAKGKGVDRHLFALKCIAEKNNMPVAPFFESGPWKTLNHTILSTSNCGNPSLRHFGFGPVVPDGFGIGYIIKDGCFHYSVSSKNRQTQRYVHTLERTLRQIGKLLRPTTSVFVEAPKVMNRVESMKLEYLDGMDYWGELDLAAPVQVPATTLKSNANDSSEVATKFLARVVRRESSVGLDFGEEVPFAGSPELTLRKARSTEDE